MPMLWLCPSATAVSVPGPILFLYVKKNSKLHIYRLKVFFMILRHTVSVCHVCVHVCDSNAMAVPLPLPMPWLWLCLCAMSFTNIYHIIYNLYIQLWCSG